MSDDIVSALKQTLAKFNENHDEHGRFGSGGSGGSASPSLRERAAAAREWLRGKNAGEVIAAAAANHGLQEKAKEGLSFAVQSLISHGTGLDAGTWKLNEAVVDHVIGDFSTIANVTALQSKQAIVSTLNRLISARQKQVAARMRSDDEPIEDKQTHRLDDIPMHDDPVLDILMRCRDAVVAANAKGDEGVSEFLEAIATAEIVDLTGEDDEMGTGTKDFALKIKALDEPGAIEGYASVFGVRDSANEIVMPGAFSDSLSRHKREGSYPLMLWQHNTQEPIGVWDDLSDDGKGLFAKGRLLVDQNVPEADKAYALLKAGAVRGMSIGYREIDVEPSTNGDARKLMKLDLLECSIVSFPANRRALVESVKSDADVKAIKFWKRFEDLARKFRDGEPMPAKEYEEILREAGFPKSVAVQIASVGYVKSIRSESGGEEAKAAIARLRDAAKAFANPR